MEGDRQFRGWWLDPHVFLRALRVLLAWGFLAQGQDAPSNDRFAAAAKLSGAWADVLGNNRLASLEDGEPTVGNLPVAATLWWQWTAPTSGLVELAISGGDFIPVVGVFREEMIPSALIASNYFNNPTAINTAPLLRFPAEAGTTYRFQAGSVWDVRGDYFPLGEIRLRLAVLKALLTAPTNGAAFTAPASVPIAATLNDFDGQVQRVVFRAGTNVIAELQQRPMSFNWEAEQPGLHELTATAVDELGRETTSPPVSITVRPANDAFVARLPIAGPIAGSLSGAASEPGEPESLCPGGSQTVWWSWTAPADGHLAISTRTNSPIVPVMALYAGAQLSSLTRIATNTYVGHGRCGTFCSTRPVLETDVRAGVVYQLQLTATQEALGVFGFPPQITVHDGPYVLELEFFPRPGNDSFARRTLIQGHSTTLSTTTQGTLYEPDEPTFAGETNAHTAWFEWTAPFNGRVTVSLRPIAGAPDPTVDPGAGGGGSGFVTGGTVNQTPCLADYEDPPAPAKFAPLLGVFEGNALTALQFVGSATDGLPEVWFNAVAGRTYSLAASGVQGTQGSYRLFLLATPPPANDQFTNRVQLEGDSLQVSAHNRGAGTDPLEPPPAHGSLQPRSIWWSWTAPRTGTLSLGAFGDDGTPLPLTVFTGSHFPNLTQVTTGFGGSAFNVEEAQEYHFAVYGAPSGPNNSLEQEGPVEFRLLLRSPALSLERGWPLEGPTAPGVVFDLQGGPTQRFQIEWSENLVDWFRFGEGELETEHSSLKLPLPGWRLAFFRVRPMPD